jgi:signal transduction histidine kinase
MTVAVTIALVSASVAVYVAALSWRLSLAPGWGDQRWFSVAALTVAVYACLDVSTTLAVIPEVIVIWSARGQMLVAGIHVYAWIRYSDLHLGGKPGRVRAVLEKVPLAIGAFSLVPGVVFHDALRERAFEPLGLTYRDVVTTPFGEASFALQLLVFVILAGRYARAWRRGVRHAAVHFLSLAYLSAMVANDALAASGVLATPYLIDIGFIVPVGAVAYSLTARFTADARALAELRDRLETLVEDRTRELARAQEQVLRSEKLAAIGRLAAGLAHEVNSPAAAASANLRYVLAARPAGSSWPEDSTECLADAVTSIERITRMMGDLRDAGRLADAPGMLEPVHLASAVRESVRAAVARCGERARLVVEVDERFYALAQEGLLVQVLANLIVNGMQAIPEDRRDGRVTVRCHRAPGRLRLEVEDNGAGIAPEALRHVFEPFFSTKPFGEGSGLGLAISRGLVQSLGGDLRLESAAGRGTTAVVDLPLARARREPPGA